MVIHTPPLGWNTWNTFGPNINEQLVKESADAMVASGLKDVGYEYIVIDDCWSKHERDENGRLVADPEKFPNGMKAVADYVHSKGLKFGMYSCAAHLTCAAYPGSYDYEFIDAATFAEWGVDFLKYDYCFHPQNTEGHYLYKRMGLALANCGRDILFSACSWGVDNTHEWAKTTGAHMWRSTGDINDTWQSVKTLAMQQFPLQKFNGQGCFNDIDMLIVGMNGQGNVSTSGSINAEPDAGVCGETEYRTHFSFWALLNSPLMIGCDIRGMSEETKKLLTNAEVLKINQDPAQRQPYEIFQKVHTPGNDTAKEICCIAKLLDNGDLAIGMFNFTDRKVKNYLATDVVGLPVTTGKTLELHDLWNDEIFTVKDGIYLTSMEPHDCKLFRARVVDIQ